MLILSRRPGEWIDIGDTVRVVIAAIKGDSVRLGIEAPHEVIVNRREITEQQRRRVERAIAEGRIAIVREQLDNEENYG